jgi:hypothetical protein
MLRWAVPGTGNDDVSCTVATGILFIDVLEDEAMNGFELVLGNGVLCGCDRLNIADGFSVIDRLEVLTKAFPSNRYTLQYDLGLE